MLSTSFADKKPLNSYPNPQILEFHRRQEKAEKILKELDHQIDWYLNSLYPKEWLVCASLGQEAQDRIDKSEALKEEFQKLKEAFIAFRKRLENCHLLCPGSAYEGLAGASEASFQITNWFASHIQDQFFPSDWRENCQMLLPSSNANNSSCVPSSHKEDWLQDQ